MKSVIFLISSSLILSACASGKVTLQPPSQKIEIENEKVIDKDFNTAWDDYVAELSKSFFVINNISKDSHIINVSFSTNKPSDFVDCGTSVVNTKHPVLGEKNFRYKVADSISYWLGVNGTNNIVQRERSTSLDGRVNIYMTPKDKKTFLRVNANYVMKIFVSQGNAPFVDSREYSTTFPTNSIGKFSDGNYCRATGRLEEDLMKLAN
ncbi:hypothetical protein TH25_06390 [Thalassospira profundimaris]|uniref:Lipoprotein n=1 Tax=Thalassospira profundimaris TaxID=502049 RepID=A0A367XFI4_9PROT|nr:hypothetical protein [Thalassospira profundimaris]RCK52169.1 hypothetical protein TH25_06390 [Thalassospira profundimaris]